MPFQSENRTYTISTKEFIALIASLMSIVAISIDAILPALGVISSDIQLQYANQGQYIISSLFLGMAIGQLICGPFSDATGRKKVLYLGVLLFLLGSLICFYAQDLNTMLLGRFIQGLGVSGPYVSAVSIVRDQFSGNQMAKVMSFVMLIFIMVPAVAPSLGQAILLFASWRYIFAFYIVYAIFICLWIVLRLEETLPKEKRIPFTTQGFAEGFKEVLSNRATMGYTICIGLFFGSFVGYLNSSQQIFQIQFETGKLFTLYFGILALVFGAASLVNAQLVERLGMKLICDYAILAIIISSAVFLAMHALMPIQLWMFLCYASLLFFSFGLIFGNINAMAMESMGHVAGIASAIIGAISSVISLCIGTFIGQLYNNSLIPVVTGFLVLSGISLVIMKAIAREPGITVTE